MKRFLILSALCASLLSVPASLMAQKSKVDEALWADATRHLCASDDDFDMKQRADVIIRDVGVSTLDQAANDRVITAMVLRGIGEANGLGGFPRNLANAREDIRTSAKRGHPIGMLVYANEYQRPGDWATIMPLYKKAAAMDCPIASTTYATSLAVYPASKDRAKDVRTGRLILTELASKGHGGAQFVLGTLLFNGQLGSPPDKANGIRWIKASAEQKTPVAMERLALAYLKGEGVEKDPQKGIDILIQMAELGGVTRYVQIGDLYLEGKDVPQDLAKAKKYFDLAENAGAPPSAESRQKLERLAAAERKREEQARAERQAEAEQRARIARYEQDCSPATPSACMVLADLYDKGKGVPKDLVKVLEYDKIACEGKKGLSCRNAGFAYQNGRGVAVNRPRALEFYKLGCELNDKDSCFEAGQFYSFGFVGQPDHVTANRYYEKACDVGVGAACANLAVAHAQGLGTPINRTKKRQFNTKACDLEIAESCYFLAQDYFNGRGVQVDYNLSYNLFERACEKNDKLSCAELGYMNKEGLGVPVNPSKSADFYSKACKFDHAHSCFMVGLHHIIGDVRPSDRNVANQYFRKALRLDPGLTEARDFLNRR